MKARGRFKVRFGKFTPEIGFKSTKNVNGNCPVIYCSVTNHPKTERRKTATFAPPATTLWGGWAQLGGASAPHVSGEACGHVRLYWAGTCKMTQSQGWWWMPPTGLELG